MKAPASTPWPTRLAGIVGTIVLTLGGLVLLGWFADIRVLRSVEPDWPSMSPATAFGLIVAGFSLRGGAAMHAPSSGRTTAWRRIVAEGGSVLLIAIGGLHLGILAAGHETNLSWLSHRSWSEAPAAAQMSPMTALDFMLFGTALWLATAKKLATAQLTLGLATYLGGCMGICRYAFAGAPLWATTNMALLSAVSFTALGFATMCMRPDAGVGLLLAGNGLGARSLRRYLPAALVAPFVVAGLLVFVKEPGRVGAGTSLAILAAISAALSFGLVWLLAARQEQETRAQARLVAIVNSSDDAIIGKTLDGVITTWNFGAERVFGYTAAEVIGQPVTMLIPPDLSAEEPAILARITRGERVAHFETTRLRKGGERIAVSVTISPVLDTAGRIVGASKIARDITAVKKAEAALRLSESVVRDAGRMAHVGGWCFNPLTGEGTWTEEVARIHDLSPDAPASVSRGLNYYVGESRAKIEAAVKAAVENGMPYDLELEFESATGRRKWVRTIGEPVIENGRVVQVRGAFQDITEQRRAEEARARMAEIVQGMTEACFALDGEWRFTFVNGRGEALLRTTQAEAKTRSFWEFFSHLIGTPLEERCRRAMRERLPEAFEIQVPRAGHWFDVRLFPSGNGLAAFMLDIHARKEAEASLRLFRELMDRTQEGIEVVDPETALILDVNEAACRQLGYTREEYLQLSVFDVDPLLSPEKFAAVDARLRETGSVVIEQVHRRKDGTEFPVELSLNRVSLEREYIVALARDITDRQRAERALRESEENFRQVVENIHEVFWIADAQSRDMLYVSPAYERIWGRSGADPRIAARTWVESIVADDRPRVLEAIGSRQAAGTYHETYRIERPDRTMRWIQEHAFPVRDEHGAVRRIVGVAEDITERKSLEAQFLRAQRMEAVGTLASGIAHDLNNILAPVLMVAPLVREKLADAHDAALIDMVEQAAQRGANIIRQLLTFSRGIEGERGPVQVKHLVREMVALMQETFPREIEISSSAAAQLWPVVADATQLHQVLMNLCVNARDAMPKGGKLSVGAQNAVVEKGEIAQHPDAPPGPYVLVTVSDTGQGIPPENLVRIFEPFFTTKELGKGTGLGLSTVLGIVKSHGGFVTVYSELGRGTVFKAYLPADLASAASVATTAPVVPRGRQELILIVDDEAPIRISLQRTLETHNYRVLTATNGEEAVRRFLEHRDGIKLVFTDLMMPGMNGLDLIRALRNLEPHLKIVAASGLHDRGRQEELAALGIHSLLAKPFTPLAALEAINLRLRPSQPA